ncbi:hypothetical protein QJS10_CPA03g00796 [Acorus calamus]|uniref:Uncharacterized protein n=1 Tax=Acorus calamus TaxID=4465 RepID=A0AAV9FA67_ACOCL|nr:hypothetical protein QJS10_CPA03g00796 [Acorus calamus]
MPTTTNDLNVVTEKGKGPLRGESSKVALSVRLPRETLGTVSVKASSNSALDKGGQSSVWVPVKHAGPKATKASDVLVQDNSFKVLSEVIEEEHHPAQPVHNNLLDKVTAEEPIPEVTHQGKTVVVADCSEVTNLVLQPIILNPTIVSTAQAEESHSDHQREKHSPVESLTPLTGNTQVMQAELYH